ncbi:mucin-2 [Aplochiton taeniatus]
MGMMRAPWLCILALSVSCIVKGQTRKVRNHVNSICSTWGQEHFKSFDGDVYQFAGMCEYNLVSDCHKSYQEFSVHMKRGQVDGSPTVKYLVVTINDLEFRLSKHLVLLNDEIVHLPYHNAGVQLERNAVYTKLQSKVGLVVMWNGDDAVMVEVSDDYANRTCGLCGDFNGVAIYDEFIHKGRKISPIEFGNKQKIHRPNDNCEDPFEEEEDPSETATMKKCMPFRSGCEQLLRSEKWSSCLAALNPEPYIQACALDQCGCTNTTAKDLCVCSTLEEYSRQCSHAGGQPPNWRTPQFCGKECPFNMVYLESGSPCMNTCMHSDTSSLCEEHQMDGCFCPAGTVFDDISHRGCVPLRDCQCKHDKVYNTGEIYRQDREECTCFFGKWSCESLESPATCSVEEGSRVTTFDGNSYTFHGDCYYTLAKVDSKDNVAPKFTILAQLAPCVSHEFDTCLKSVVILLNNDRNNAMIFTADGKVKHNAQINLPYSTADINIFQASSFHIMLQTSFGLQIQIQLVPLMQVYVTLETSYQAKTRGLCGNYNMVLSDDLKSPQGMVEGTASSFGNSWKSNPTCLDREERLDNPCSLSVENEKYAEHWCSMLRSPNSTFENCHAMVDPELYYKRCTYASCSCEKSEDCLCAVFSSYARACASKGVFLTGWRDSVCDKYTGSCPASQTFSYKLQRCQLTCMSLGSERQGCSSDFLPVDGCSCPEGLYLDAGICVPMAKCSCYHDGLSIKPGKSINIRDEHCVCTNGKLHCRSWRTRSQMCPSPKVHFNCSTAGTGELGVQCARTCRNLDSDDCFSACESGCQCPSGLVDDGKGSCVKEQDCPCHHDGFLYASGRQVPVQCNTCTCKRGKWECTENECPGTCIIYGGGHYNTFDQKKYGFQGECAYVAMQNKCGNRTNLDNFGVITENIPCGTSGTTCSKSVRIQLGRTEIKLAKGTYEEVDLGVGSETKYKVRRIGLYLAIESDIGLVVLWDRKTTIRIILEPNHRGQVCGLCGDFNGDGQNDFTTQGQLVVSNALEFANSWKVDSKCPDAENNNDPCGAKPNRHNWAKVQCSLIIGPTFKNCHKKVDPLPFYENCVRDSCACDSGGDCECFCTAVAAYAQACNEAEVCVAWRTPDICPVFCDYYNAPEECNWHYSPCHTPCYKTCLNPQGICSNPIPNLEGCYPVCPEDKPIFDEKNKTCVEKCDGCFYNGTAYEEHEVIYNVTDNLGMCYYAICKNTTVIFGETIYDQKHIGSGVCLTMICSGICEIQNSTGPCPSPTPPPITCPEWDKVQNETFWLCNCTMARCIENNTIEIIPYECPPLEEITCANEQKPVLVYDEFYCCQHYVCDCMCEGWGDPHYITFDGLFYSYQGNCTYTLMEEITSRYNLRIYIDNVLCDPTEDVSCPRSIIVSYGSQVITLKNHNLIGTAQLEAQVNGVSRTLPFSHSGVKVVTSGITMVLEISKLEVVVKFGITGFSVYLPFKYFGNNTQGHCGTCNNNQADDCMLPGGQLVQSCAVMADYWPAKDLYQPDCLIPSVLPTSSPVSPPTKAPCRPDSICNLLKSSVFEECHPFVSPDKFFEGCVFDSCHMTNPTVECTSLQTYASVCSLFGVCLHWRNHTTLCPSDCPADKVYKPCGPAEQPTCEDDPNQSTMNITTEGCFCPDGMKLFNKESGICVSKCGCIDPEGIPREFEEQFEYKCQDCICKESTKTVTCKPKVCPAPPVETCTGPGFVLTNQTDPTDPCCSSHVCRCDSSTCPPTDMNCPIGYVPVVNTPVGKCCPERTCDPKRVCVHKNLEYQPGSSVPVVECQDCTCTHQVEPATGWFKIVCQLPQCDTTCETGYEYVETDSDECCGKCVQTHCFININQTQQLLKPGETWSPPGNNCERYNCVKNGDSYVTSGSSTECPLFRESNCETDTIQTAANGCCKICVEKKTGCKLGTMKAHIQQHSCQSVEEVDMPYCEGACNTFTKYSELASVMQHHCSCCQESRSSNRTVNLKCLNGDIVPYTYIHVEECSCSHTDCTRYRREPVKSGRRRRMLGPI